MKRYESYKPSVISWIEEIPSHWETKYLFQYAKEHFISNKGIHHHNLLSLSYGNIIRKDINKTDGLLPESFDTYQIVKPGNIILRLTDLQNDHKSLRVGLVKEEGIITSAYVCLEIESAFLPVYFYYFLHTLDLKKIFYSMGGGLRQNLNFNGLRKLEILLPPIEEQEKIVEFLSDKTKLIDEQQKNIDKEIQYLQELKQAEIANTVCKGLNPDVPMKDSGIRWIGQIPEHWEIAKLRQFLKLFSEKGHGDKTLLSVTRELGVIVRNKDNKEENHNFIPDDLSGYKLVKNGQFVVNKMKSWQGSYGVSNYEGIVSPAYYVCDLNFPYKPFFSLAIRSKSYIPFFTQMSKGIRVDQWDLSTEALKSIPFIIPPIEEQKAIVEYIEQKNKFINEMIANLRAEIDFLTEYKQRLISDAVTGQIDVRNYKSSTSAK